VLIRKKKKFVFLTVIRPKYGFIRVGEERRCLIISKQLIEAQKLNIFALSTLTLSQDVLSFVGCTL
jgi:hypothetical protein